MSELVKHSRQPIELPGPRVPLNVRLGTPGDLPFIDKLQKVHAKMVGWMPTIQLEEKINAGHVLVAETEGLPAGYVIGRDQYFKRDDVGIIYQMNVIPGCQRCLVGATLLKAMFARAAYGCKLFCCWCAQDIGANKFWEAMGFVPLAFRAGSREKGRVHIFWQRRIRAGDTTTPWWFPSQTSSGAIREDRLVLPIPPGMHWSDVMPVVLPRVEERSEVRDQRSGQKKRLPGPRPSVTARPSTLISAGGLRFANPPAAGPEEPPPPKPPKGGRKPKVKNDPKLIAAARELRDRWLEHINAPGASVLTDAKYDVSRGETAVTVQTGADPSHLLPAA